MLLSISILLRGLLRPLRQIEAEIGEPLLSGISVFANAVPVMNVDLKAWEPGETFEKFLILYVPDPCAPADLTGPLCDPRHILFGGP